VPSRNLFSLTLLGFVLWVLVSPAYASEGAGEQNIFNADIGNFVFTLIIFGLVVYVLGRAAWKPLLNVLNEREGTIRESLESARKRRDEAEQLLADYKAQLASAREDATKIVAEGRRDAEEVNRRLQEEARQQAADIVDRARREIEVATDAAKKDLLRRTAELAVDVADRIIRKELTPQDHEALVTESLDRMKAAGRETLN